MTPSSIEQPDNRITAQQFKHILNELRAEAFHQFTLLVIVFGAVLAYLTLFVRPLPLDMLSLTLALALGAVVVRYVNRKRKNLARYAFIAFLHLCLYIGMILFPFDWIPLLGLPLLFMSSVLVSYSNVFSALSVWGFAATLTWVGYADYSLDVLLMLLVVTFVISQTGLQTIYTALYWYSSMHRHSDNLLQEARDRQAHLSQTLKSLDISYQIQKRMRQQLIYARQQANEARRLKERFAANISHELRTPLNLIMGFSEIMYLTPEVYGGVNFPPKLCRDIYQIHQNSRHLLEMIDDVLDLSHIEISSFSLNFELTNLNHFMVDTGEMLHNLFHSHAVQFVLQIEPDLPHIDIDRTRIRQVLLNLLNNAQRFTEQGSVTLTIYQQETEVLFRIADTGMGIPADKLPYVFDEFFQVDYSLSRSHGGAGLGLAITKRFIEAHNGVISVQSQEGIGTTFEFALPVPKRYRRTYSSDTSLDNSHDDVKQTLIVIDPDPVVATMIQRQLDTYQVVAVPDEAALVDAVIQYQPRLVIHNVLPNQTPSPPPIPLTMPYIECSLPTSQTLVSHLGVAACLSKPVSMREMAAHIERFAPLERILIVDDDLGFVQLVQRSIEVQQTNYHLFRAYDGLQALDSIRQNRPDLILLDLAMPAMDGFQVIDAIRKDETIADTPIILLTATRHIDAEIDACTKLVVQQQYGLTPAETLRCLRVLVDQLEPRADFA